MPGRFAMFVTGFIIALAVIYLPDSQIVSGQSANAPTRFAAVPGEKGGQDIFGAYDVVADWPKDLSTIKGHEGWTFGAGQSVFAESPNRIFVLQRGELPNLGRPKGMRLTELGPASCFRSDACRGAMRRRQARQEMAAQGSQPKAACRRGRKRGTSSASMLAGSTAS